MIIDRLRQDMVAAWKSKDIDRKTVLSNMIDAIQKAAVGPKGRAEITDDLANEALMKYQKTAQEQYDTCPNTEKYSDLKEKYSYELAIVKEYAPQLIVDKDIIKQLINQICTNNKLNYHTANKGQIMKTIMPALKQKHCDMKVVQNVLKELS